jgi:hypothetical protein
MYFEALEFANQLGQNPTGYGVDMSQLNLGAFATDNGELAINQDPFFAMRGLALIMNWAGARQRIGSGAGNQDVPAIDAGNFGERNRTEPISAFSLVVTRYSDSVIPDDDPNAWSALRQSSELVKMIQAVEGTVSAAEQLGYTVGGEESDIQ